MKKKQKINHSTRQLTSLKGYLIFIALSVASLAWLVMKSSWLAFFGVVFMWIRLYKGRQLLLLVSCFFVSVLFGSYFFWQTTLAEQGKQLEAITSQTHLLVDPNSLEIDGDYLSFEGQDRSSRELVALSYRFQSLSEKEAYQAQTTYFEISAKIELKVPMGQRNLNGFDYRQSLVEKGIYRQGSVLVMGQRRNQREWWPSQVIKKWRRQLSVHIDRNFSKVTASYMKSLLLGIKDSAFKQQQVIWGQLGILHFFSLSGMHVFFFVSHFRQFFLRLRLTKERLFWLELAGLFVYLFLTGFSTGIGRSVFYIGLRSVNRRFKGHFSELDCWSGTLLISLLVNPYLLFQASGQLSFGLSFYIIYLKPLIGKLGNIQSQLVFSVVLSSLAVPIMSANFYEWHLLGSLLTFLLMPVFNYLLLPLLSLLLAMSTILKVDGLFQLIEEGLTVFQQALGSLSAISVLNVVTGRLEAVTVFGCLMLSLAWLHYYHRVRIVRWLMLVTILSLPSLGKYADFGGIIAFVDVGQGDSLFIQGPFHQKAILVDTGGSLGFASQEEWQKKEHQTSQGRYTLIPFLKSRGIKSLDQVFITHAHEDHFGDLQELSREVKIKTLYYPKGTAEQVNFQESLKAISKKTKKQVVSPGDYWQNQDYRLTVLSPEWGGNGGNNDSLVLSLTLRNKKLLLTGDLEGAGEQKLLTKYPKLTADILKIGHHGSNSSSTALFLEQIKVKTGIISVGLNNRFGHPHHDTLARLSQANIRVYQTDQQGMVYYNWSHWSADLSEPKTIRKVTRKK